MLFCESVAEICAVVGRRQKMLCELYRFIAASVQSPEAKALLERLAKREEEFLGKLDESGRTGEFRNRPCDLSDEGLFRSIEPPDLPSQTIPEILAFAIGSKHDGYLFCREAARRCAVAKLNKLWLALAEEERRHRLELESCYRSGIDTL